MKAKSANAMPDFLQKRVIEGIFILLMSLSLFLLIALFTYHPYHLLQNAGGRVGAWFADKFIFVFGYFAYLFPLMLAYTAWLLLQERHRFDFDWRLLAFRSVGMLFILLAGCGLASLQTTAGGFIGQLIAMGLDVAFNIPGSALLLSATLLIGITLFTGLSWLMVCERVGRMTWIVLTAIPPFCRRWWQSVRHYWQQWQARRAKRAQQVKVAPVITPTVNVNVNTSNKPKIISQPKSSKKSKRYQKERQAELFVNREGRPLPSLSLLDEASKAKSQGYTTAELEMMSREVEERLADFGVTVNVVAVNPGPVITRFELNLAPGVKASKITNLAKDLARSLSVTSVRVVEVIPGKPVVGLELPNKHREMVRLSEVLATENYEKSKTTLTLALGVDISGSPVIVDLMKMPHLLVAGTTGSGKSVGLNAMLLSLLYKLTPDELRLIMIDPKMLELSVYDGIPHLLTPVVTDMKEAANALRWCVAEMERRYRLMAAQGVRNLSGFNKQVREAIKNDKPLADPLWNGDPEIETCPTLEPLPLIVVVIDELADMMMVVGKKVEQLIARIAQKARAAGIHLILATQRPSVDVLTGLIKSNIPTRIAFQVSSKIDSRTILDQQGADQLLGHGDMLYLPPGTGNPIRVHGAFVDDHEVHNVTKDWKQRGEPDYVEAIVSGLSGDMANEFIIPGENAGGSDTEDSDPLYDEAVQFVVESRRASISSVQRRLKVGYNRAARLIEEMERTGIVSPMESNGTREVLVPAPPKD